MEFEQGSVIPFFCARSDLELSQDVDKIELVCQPFFVSNINQLHTNTKSNNYVLKSEH